MTCPPPLPGSLPLEPASMPGRYRRRLMLMVACGLMSLSTLQAQAPVPAPPPTQAIPLARSWYFEAAIVVVMMGLALFVVCRSSRRN